ncbi:Rad17 cell cycle checkpoint protein-domain-containing protein [Gongronella butleri]|nr:Rad17 cell cycle checkpoint protein-domain-containing protein [Gongronella butleri]
MSSQPHFILPLHSTQQTRRPHRSNPPSPSFAVPHSPTSSSSGVENACLQWDEKHAPQVPDELAVRRQKLDTMRSMIKHSALHMRQGIKLIALTGPTGAGKSTAARVLVRDMGYQVTEWVNPLRDGDYDPEHHESIMTRFDRFMDRATRPFSLESRQPKIILFDDLPDLTTPSLLQQFVAILKSYVESKRDFLMIMVISESSMQQDDGRRWRQRQYESGLLTANQILTKDMLATGRCAELEFNPVIKVNVKKVCGAILEKEKLLTQRTMDLIEHITDVCHGDLRCSIVTLQLYTLGEPVSNQTVESLKKRKRKRPSGRPSRSAAAYDSDFESSTQDSTSGRGENSNDNVHGRDDPLDLFHCIGKILFAKRENGRLASRPPAVLERSPFDHDQLLAWIFHNYDDFIVDVDQSALLMDHMADADVIGNNWMVKTRWHGRVFDLVD